MAPGGAMSVSKPLLTALQRGPTTSTPIWLMRQAGRYLPEYRTIRGKVARFLDLCLTPELAAEVTLQPLRRFELDGAILFSDILVLPYGLGQVVSFEEGKGPQLAPIRREEDIARLQLSAVAERTAAVEEALRLIVKSLPVGKTLIGFAGAPWTVACYMVEGEGGTDFEHVRAWAYGEPESFQKLIDILVEGTVDHLVRQIDAGAETLQIFDSWAGVLAANRRMRWSIAPIAAIVKRVRAARPAIPIIVFPRGVGASYVDFARQCGCDGLSLDSGVSLNWAASELQASTVLQGNLDPMLLVLGGTAMRDEAEQILRAWSGGPFVFNLGHGILPQTPPEHVAELCRLVHRFGRTS